MAPSTSRMACDDSDARLPGKGFQGMAISVPYARWRGYGTEHGYHKGRAEYGRKRRAPAYHDAADIVRKGKSH